MAKSKVAKLFLNGRSQAVRLPHEFRFEGDRVLVRRMGKGVLIEPFSSNLSDWFEELDKYTGEPFMLQDRTQPMMPERDVFS